MLLLFEFNLKRHLQLTDDFQPIYFSHPFNTSIMAEDLDKEASIVRASSMMERKE